MWGHVPPQHTRTLHTLVSKRARFSGLWEHLFFPSFSLVPLCLPVQRAPDLDIPDSLQWSFDSFPSKFSPDEEACHSTHLTGNFCRKSAISNLFFKRTYFMAPQKKINIFAKQYTLASCLPEVLLLRMNTPVFSARTESPSTMGTGRKQVSPRSSHSLEITDYYLMCDPQQNASYRRCFTRECPFVAPSQP